MKKLRELLGPDYFNRQDGDVGLEIEYEGVGFKEVNNVFWRTHDDGSLRGRFPESRGEYVFVKPLPVDKVNEALDDLLKNIPNAKADFSFRTSVHVHVNVQELTTEQILNTIYTYLLIEESLMHYCGATRKCNRFCLRLQDSEGLMDTIKQFIADPNMVKRFNGDNIRYAAINLAAITKFGSIEFRGMRGTIDKEVLSTWCYTLVSLRNFSCHFPNVLAIHDEYVKRGPEGFFKFVLGDHAKKYEYKKLLKDMEQSYSLSLDIPFAYKEREEKKKLKAEAATVGWKPDAEVVKVGGLRAGDIIAAGRAAEFLFQGALDHPAPRRRAAIPPRAPLPVDPQAVEQVFEGDEPLGIEMEEI